MRIPFFGLRVAGLVCCLGALSGPALAFDAADDLSPRSFSPALQVVLTPNGASPRLAQLVSQTSQPDQASVHISLNPVAPNEYGPDEPEFALADGMIVALETDYGLCFHPPVAVPAAPGEITETTTEPHLCDMLGPPLSPMVYRLEALPVRQLATVDGGTMEILPITVTVDGTLRNTYYFGYKLGLVARFAEPVAETGGWDGPEGDFLLESLPAPQQEGLVIEYRNTADFPGAPGGHFFYSASAEEQQLIDSGAAGAFVRTGRSFKSGGYVTVCRFYGSVSPGPNSHFFTASEAECNALKDLQRDPVPSDVQQWNYEGKAFAVNAAIPAAVEGEPPTCPAGSIPVYRAYNGAWNSQGKQPWDSNHRLSTSRAAIESMVTQYGWVDEGVVMCAPE